MKRSLDTNPRTLDVAAFVRTRVSLVGAGCLTRVLTIAAAIVLLAMFAAPLSAQPPDDRDPLLAHWKTIFDVRLPAQVDAPYLALNLPTIVFGKARQDVPDLPDLRLIDAKGKHVPYVLRVLRGESQQITLPIARQFNDVPSPAHHRRELSLELANVPAAGHNEIAIFTSGINFRRKVEVFGDSDDKFTNPRPFLGKGKFLVKYDIDGQLIDIHRFHYQPQQFRFLQIHVYADGAEEIPSITQVVVRHTVNVPGEFVTEPASFDFGDKAQPVRSDGGRGSAWFINLPGEGLVPCQKLKFEVAGPPSERPFHLFIANPNQPLTPIGGAVWQWSLEKDNQFLEISFPEVVARRLRLVVTDSDNEPFFMKSVQATRAVRQLVFAKPDDKNYTPPLRLFAGNPAEGPPNYDLAQKLPPDLKLAPPFAELGESRQNPAWTPPPPTLNERMPWLVYVVLGVACLILLAILGSLARQAMRRHDQAQASPHLVDIAGIAGKILS